PALLWRHATRAAKRIFNRNFRIDFALRLLWNFFSSSVKLKRSCAAKPRKVEEDVQLFLRKQSFLATFVAVMILTGIANRALADLEQYVRRPETGFEWKLKDKIEQSGDRIYDLHLVSQNWRGSPWTHQLQVYQPRNVAPNSTMFLWVTGGSARGQYISLGLELARKMNAPVAFLYNIPNQPLLENRLYEDDLI